MWTSNMNYYNVAFFVFLFNIVCTRIWAQTDEDIQHVQDIIVNGIGEANNYHVPTSAEEYRPSHELFFEEFGSWDFIVIGSGCGGAVVANRLSEVKKWKVLLLEAGGNETEFSVIPAMHLYLHFSRINWGYYSTPQKYACLGMYENRCPVVRGKALGGSSAINYEFYSRANKGDYNTWAAQGNPGWSYDEILPYFIKSENSQINGDPGYHGRDGYWNVKYVRPVSEQFTNFMEGSRIVQNYSSKDYNGRDELGIFQMQLNNELQYRESTNRAFLQPIIGKRSNLRILTNAYVTKLLVTPGKKKVLGVIFSRNKKQYIARARKEVILAAGAINTPQILMLSGIGPTEHLQKMNIPVINDLPVGKTLYDHSVFYAAYIGTNHTEPTYTLRQQIIQFLNDYGTLTIPSNSQGLGFFQTLFEKDPYYPDLELIVNVPDNLTTFLIQDLKVSNETYQAIANAVAQYKSIMNTFTFVLKPQSVGSVTLKSNNPYDYVNIDINFLAEQHDVEVMYQGIQRIQRILDTEPLRRLNATLIQVDYPQCRKYQPGSKDYWICCFRLITASSYHQSGTCRMGPDPKTSVVDSKGKVHGMKNLRIVDASIFPTIVAGHTAAPTVMIGEKLSDVIKSEYGIPIQPITNVIN